MTAAGWIKLFRKFREWRWYKDDKTKSVFIELLLLANHKDHAWQGMTVQRGQVVTSLPSLAKALGYSVRNVRTALDHLVTTGEISQNITNLYRLVTVNNYDVYQGEEDDFEDEVTGDRQANRQANRQAKRKQNDRLKDQHNKPNDALPANQTTGKSTGKSTDEVTALEEDKEDKEYSLSLRLTDEAFAWLGSTMPPLMVSDIEDLIWAGQADEDLVLEAIKIAKGKGKRSWPYAHGVLKGMISDGYTTGQAYRDARAPRTAGDGNKGERGVTTGGKYREQVDWRKHMETVEDED